MKAFLLVQGSDVIDLSHYVKRRFNKKTVLKQFDDGLYIPLHTRFINSEEQYWSFCQITDKHITTFYNITYIDPFRNTYG